MAKRKRASLKDKSPETLGLTSQKKSKGMDLLFGGPVEGDSAEESSTPQPVAADEAAPSPVDGGDRAVDELGLPVALEEPPDDLILASPSSVVSDGEEVDAVNPSTSPFAMANPEDNQADDFAGDADDLSGLVEEDNSSVEDTKLADSTYENDLSGLVEDTSSDAGTDDLSGLIIDDGGDLSGLTAAPAPSDTAGGDFESTLITDDAGDLSGLIIADEDMSGMTTSESAAPPPAPATPDPVPVAQPVQPASQPAPAEPYYPPQPAPVSAPVAPSPPPPQLTSDSASVLQSGVQIQSIAGVVTDGSPVSARDILPEDALTKTGGHKLEVEKREKLERDEAATEKILKYIGPERRKQLDDEIMDMYSVVADELSDNKEDVGFALKTLREAQDIVIEDPSQYDEALYRVSVVRTMLVRKQNLRRWSYTWGMFVFFYALVWLIVFVAGIYYVDPSPGDADLSAGAAAIRSAWLSCLAGGIGGVMAILYSLSWRVAIKHEFDRQYIMKYLVQPVMGFVLGAVIFFITSAGFLAFNTADVASGESVFLGGPTLVALTLLLGFIAGFRQRVVYFMIDRIVQKISPQASSGKGPSSVVPVDDHELLRDTSTAS